MPVNLPPLDKEQRALARGVVGLVEVAAADITKRYGRFLEFDELVDLGHQGVVIAAATFDGDKGAFPHWAYYHALQAMLMGGRKEMRHTRFRAALAAVVVCAIDGEQVTMDQLLDAPEDTLDSMADILGSAMFGVLTAPQAAEQGGELSVVEREEWLKARDELDEVLGELSADQRDALERYYAGGQDLKTIAKERGVDYKTFREHYHATQRLVASRLRGRGVTRSPARQEADWNILRAAAANNDDRR